VLSSLGPKNVRLVVPIQWTQRFWPHRQRAYLIVQQFNTLQCQLHGWEFQGVRTRQCRSVPTILVYVGKATLCAAVVSCVVAFGDAGASSFQLLWVYLQMESAALSACDALAAEPPTASEPVSGVR
jgi:hypothetical protein